MSIITDEEILDYVADNVDSFHQSRLDKLNGLKLGDLLDRKNPYLFKTKNIVVVSDFIKVLLDAHLSSQEETLFGDFLEGLAIHVAEKVLGGQKSGIEGIDLEFSRNNVRYIVSIKSGPNWGNASQIANMRLCFNRARQVLRQGNRDVIVEAVNGCCYGRERRPDKGEYFKICGQAFWEFISNDPGLYTRIIEPLGHNARERNDKFKDDYDLVINRFSREFMDGFCGQDGSIDWPKLVAFISAKTLLTDRPVTKRYVNALQSLESVSDALSYWDEPQLAAEIISLTPDDSAENETRRASLQSVRGFLLFWSGVESEGAIILTGSPEGLISSRWEYPDARSVTIRFLDIDHVTVSATDIEGNEVRIRNSATSVTRQTARRRLIEHGLFTEFGANAD